MPSIATAAGATTASSYETVQMRVETDSGTSSQGNSSGAPTPTSLSLTLVQEVIPLVTDVQLLEHPVASSSVEHHPKESSSSALSVTTESCDEDTPQDEDDTEIPCATPCDNVDTTGTVAYSRPAIIFTNAIKPTSDSIVGIHFRARDGAVYISRIAHDSLFCGCNLMVGDRVVAVNNISCIGVKRATQVVELLHKTKDSSHDPASLAARTVSICVRNEQGGADPRTVSTSIQKPDRFTRVGVSLVNKPGGFLKVTRIEPDSLFSKSLLLPRHRCMRINDMPCDHLTSHEAAEFILAAADRVTIVSEPYEQAAMVISASASSEAEEEQLRGHETWWGNATATAYLAVRRMSGLPDSSPSSRATPLG
jgi:hypothetical protein